MSRSMKPSSPAASPQSPVMVWKKMLSGRWNIRLPGELAGRNRLAAGDAGQVRDDAFHLVEAPAFQIGLRGFGQLVEKIGHQALAFLKNSAILSAITALSVLSSRRRVASSSSASGTTPRPRVRIRSPMKPVSYSGCGWIVQMVSP